MIHKNNNHVTTTFGRVDIIGDNDSLRLDYRVGSNRTEAEMKEDIVNHKEPILTIMRRYKDVDEKVFDLLKYNVHEITLYSKHDIRDMRGQKAGRSAVLNL